MGGRVDLEEFLTRRLDRIPEVKRANISYCDAGLFIWLLVDVEPEKEKEVYYSTFEVMYEVGKYTDEPYDFRILNRRHIPKEVIPLETRAPGKVILKR